MRIFISYRRTDSTMFLVPDLRTALAAEVGDENVFLDIDNIPLGVDFRDHLQNQIATTDAVLAVIGSNWEPDRLADRNDFVRIELLAAQSLGKLVVPILAGGRAMLSESQLPKDLRWLSYRNAFSIAMPPRHDDDLRRLAEYFRGVDSSVGAATAPSEPLASAAPLDPTGPSGSVPRSAPTGLPAHPVASNAAPTMTSRPMVPPAVSSTTNQPPAAPGSQATVASRPPSTSERDRHGRTRSQQGLRVGLVASVVLAAVIGAVASAQRGGGTKASAPRQSKSVAIEPVKIRSTIPATTAAPVPTTIPETAPPTPAPTTISETTTIPATTAAPVRTTIPETTTTEAATATARPARRVGQQRLRSGKAPWVQVCSATQRQAGRSGHRWCDVDRGDDRRRSQGLSRSLPRDHGQGIDVPQRRRW